jgi:hypothetical protein
MANTPREYRQDAAKHLYQFNSNRIYKGRLPPLLYAIGVLDVELDRQGRVQGIAWKRAPTHAPEVMAEIEKTVRSAAPYPARPHGQSGLHRCVAVAQKRPLSARHPDRRPGLSRLQLIL